MEVLKEISRKFANFLLWIILGDLVAMILVAYITIVPLMGPFPANWTKLSYIIGCALELTFLTVILLYLCTLSENLKNKV